MVVVLVGRRVGGQLDLDEQTEQKKKKWQEKKKINQQCMLLPSVTILANDNNNASMGGNLGCVHGRQYIGENHIVSGNHLNQMQYWLLG